MKKPTILLVVVLITLTVGGGTYAWNANLREKAIYYCAEYVDYAAGKLAGKEYAFQLSFTDKSRELGVDYFGQRTRRGIWVHEQQFNWATYEMITDRTYFLAADGSALLKQGEQWGAVDAKRFDEFTQAWHFLAMDRLRSYAEACPIDFSSLPGKDTEPDSNNGEPTWTYGLKIETKITGTAEFTYRNRTYPLVYINWNAKVRGNYLSGISYGFDRGSLFIVVQPLTDRQPIPRVSR